MKRNPIPKHRRVCIRGAEEAPADSRSRPPTQVKPAAFGLTIFPDANVPGKIKREIWRTGLALKLAKCRDVLIVSTADYVRFIVTIKLSKTR